MSKTCIITGATDGIGKQTAIELSLLGFNLILIGRNREKCDLVCQEIKSFKRDASIKFYTSDLSLVSNVKKLGDQIKKDYDHIDILINNVGAYFSQHSLTSENIEKTLALNHLGYFALTNTLIEIISIGRDGRVINVASGAHFRAKFDINNLQMKDGYKGWTAYCNSKLMNILFTYQAHRIYNGKNITFNALHPGFVDTSFGDNNVGFGKNILSIGKKLIAINVRNGAKTSVYLSASNDVMKISGKYFEKLKIVSSSKISYSKSHQEKLWQLSQDFVDAVN